MASSLLSAAKSFLHPSHPQTPPPLPLRACPTSNWRLPSSRRAALRVAAQKWEPSKVVPQADRVLIRLEELPEVWSICCAWADEQQPIVIPDLKLEYPKDVPNLKKSAGGVLLPKSAVKFERYLMGEILSVGADVAQVDAGKKVLFSDINAYEVDLGADAKHCFCRAGDLLAVVE